MKKVITLLIPMYNEGRHIDVLAQSLYTGIIDTPFGAKYDWQIVAVDDGSTDDTKAALKRWREADKRVTHVSLSRNFGKENALLAGMDYVTGDATIIMDADLQHPISALQPMIEKWEEGYDDVYGRRLSRGRESILRRVCSGVFYAALQTGSRLEMLPNVGDFRLLDAKCIKALRQLRESQRYTKGLYCWIGFKKCSVDYETARSTRRASSFTPMRLINLAMDGITSFSIAPLRLASMLGFALSFLSILYMIFIVVKTLVWGEAIQGFPTLMCAILLLGGIQLLTIGIIGEYVGRIYMESKDRPVYIIDDVNGGDGN